MNRPEKIFGLTTRGLEAISADEMTSLSGITITQVAYRRVAAVCEASPAHLLNLRTLDDIFLELTVWDEITHTRDMLAVFRERSRTLNLRPGADLCAALRPINQQPRFSVTASFVGKRNYSSDEIKSAGAEGIQASHPWSYTEDDRLADFNIRLFIEHQTACVGLRLGKHALHERSYKQIERPGSLKPSVAAAMLRLAAVASGMSLLDPCCGSGTILTEAAQYEAKMIGSDIDPQAIIAANANLAAAGLQIPLHRWDARAVPLPDHSIDRIVSNLPWGRQIALDDDLRRVYHDICKEIERVLLPGGKAVLLTTLPHLFAFKHLNLIEQIEISLFGQKPVISIFQ